MQKRIVCGMVASLSLVWGAMALTNEERVGLAAADPQQVAELVAAMDAKATPLFAGEVVEAIASMPLSPVLRLRQMRDSAAAFLQAVPAAQRPELLARMVSSIPFQMLPRWVDGFKPELKAATAEMSAADYKKLATAAVEAVAGIEELSDEAKTIYTTFIITLLSRGESQEEREEFASALLPAVAAACRDQVEAALPSALQGDYAMLLGPEMMRLVEAHGKMGARRVATADALGEVAEEAERLIHDINRPAPLILRPRDGELTPTPPHHTSAGVPSSSPVIPPPYRGQF